METVAKSLNLVLDETKKDGAPVEETSQLLLDTLYLAQQLQFQLENRIAIDASTTGAKRHRVLDPAGDFQDTVKVLKKFADFLDVELLKFATQTDPLVLDHSENFKNQFNLIEKLLDRLSSVKHLLEKPVELSHNQKLALIIGLKSDFVCEIFEAITEDWKGHEGDCQVILNCLEETFQASEFSRSNEELLEEAGYTHERAKYLVDNATELALEHHGIMTLGLSFVEDLFDYHLLLTKHNTSNYQDPGQPPNQPYSPLMHPYGASETVKFINTYKGSETEETKETLRTIFETSSESRQQNHDDFKFWYHATTSRSAENIFRQGIQLNKGKACKDFSNGNGFYLSNNFRHAKDFAQSKLFKKYFSLSFS